MAKNVELQIQGSTTLTFDVEGTWLPRYELVYRENANPPTPVEARIIWEFEACRLKDASQATLLSDMVGVLNRFDPQVSTLPTYARLVRDPAGTPTTLIELGPGGGYEQLRVEVVELTPDPDVDAASYLSTATFNLRLSAVSRKADVNGIVGLDQVLRRTHDGGLAVIELETTLTVKEGVSALTKAQQFAALDVRNYGTDFTYETNSTSGLDWDLLDADEVNGRTPTVIRCVSRLRQWGVSVGTTSPGTGPSEIGYAVRTETTATETITTTTVMARGPGYLSWVQARRPTGVTEGGIEDDQGRLTATGVWRRVERNTTASPFADMQVLVEISGGHQQLDWEPVSSGYPPLDFYGALLPWTLRVTALVRYRGGEQTLNEHMKLPGRPGGPWVLDHNASSESEPELVEPSPDGQHRWERRATLVYRSPVRPSESPLARIREADRVESYYLGAA